MNESNSIKKNSRALYSLPVKTTAVILFVIIATVTILFGAAFIIICADGGFYSSDNVDEAFYNSEFCLSSLKNIAEYVARTLDEYAKRGCQNSETFLSVIESDLQNRIDADPNRTIVIELSFGNKLQYSYGKVPESYGALAVERFHLKLNLENEPDMDVGGTVTVYQNKPISDYSTEHIKIKNFFDFFFSIRYTAAVVTILGSIASIALFVYLMRAAGHRYGEETVRERFVDRIPYDITVLILLTALCVIALIVRDINYDFERRSFSDTIVLLAATITAVAIPTLLILLEGAYTTAVRIKTRTLFKNTVIWRLCKLVWKIASSTWQWVKSVVLMLPATGLTAIAVPAYIFFNVFFAFALVETIRYGSSIEAFITFLIFTGLNILVFVNMVRSAYELVLLRQGSSKLAEGHFEHKLDSDKLHGEAKKISQNLNSIGDGMARAVEQRSKSERMKVELITNVSHDLKTPITSIINYVDLLKKEPMQSDTAVQYLEVLDRQASRLRKLTADIIEASKASTGNIEVIPAPTDICELISQSAAEYAQKFDAANLTPVIRTPDKPIVAYADGRLLWRVLDNLLSNVCKYSLPGTRVYLDATCGESMASVTVRNISAAPLGGIDPDELTERFVRGDSARSGEGSGLGLSIARSLTELQGGRLSVAIDGDMFKVSVTVPLAVS